MDNYKIFTDATADITEAVMEGLPPVEVIPMRVEIGNWEYLFGPGGNISADEFYKLQRAGSYAKTASINPFTYYEAFSSYLKKGIDVIYLCFSSGLSGTIVNAKLSMENLKEEYPERKILCVDTLCASVGEAFLVREAARKQSEGLSIEELYEWVLEYRLRVCHWFTVDTFEHLYRGGRVSATAAAAGTVLQIKPLLHVDEKGKLVVAEKPRGRKRATALQLSKLEQGRTPELGQLIIIGHGDCPYEALNLKNEIEACYPDSEIIITDIGPVVGTHTGPGMLAVIFWGTIR